MSARELTVLTDVSMINCIVQRSKADDVVRAAQDAGAQGTTIYYGIVSGERAFRIIGPCD
ncbi:MAG: nitrogen regulatory protein P-II 1 [Flavobacterium sp.]|jgi:nitrogen regulatory protein P-II 1